MPENGWITSVAFTVDGQPAGVERVPQWDLGGKALDGTVRQPLTLRPGGHTVTAVVTSPLAQVKTVTSTFTVT